MSSRTFQSAFAGECLESPQEGTDEPDGLVSIRFRWRVFGEDLGVVQIDVPTKFQSAFAEECLESNLGMTTVTWKAVSIRFRWRVFGEFLGSAGIC